MFNFKRSINGKFSSFKSWCKKVWYWSKVTVAVVAVGAIIFGTGMAFASTSTVVANGNDVNELPAKIAQLQAGVVDQIKGCETPDLTVDDAPLILDTNNKMSIGKLMFQIATVQEYYKSLYGQDITRKDAVEIALDEASSTQLATDIIFKTSGGVDNWLNCANKLDLASKVTIIKQLSK